MTEGGASFDASDPPPPGALTDTMRALDDFAAGRPAKDDFVGGLLLHLGFGEREAGEYRAGSGPLWSLIPPITVEDLRDADLGPPALISMALVLVLNGRHTLAFWAGRIAGRRLPEPLMQLEKLARFVAESLEQAGRSSSRGAVGSLDALRQDLQALRSGLEAAAREGDNAADGVQGGLATARRDSGEESKLRGLLSWGRRRGGDSGAFLRSVTQPGLAMLTGENAIVYATDPQVPVPLGLYDYVQALDEWSWSRPVRNVLLAGLLPTVIDRLTPGGSLPAAGELPKLVESVKAALGS